MLTYILKLDFLGPSVGLNHYGTSRYQTLLGVFFSVAAIVLAAFSVQDTINDVFRRENPVYVISKNISKNNAPFSQKDFIIYFKIQEYDTYTGKTEEIKTNPLKGRNLLNFSVLSESPNNIDGFDYMNFTNNEGKVLYADSLGSCDNAKIFQDYNSYLFFAKITKLKPLLTIRRTIPFVSQII